MSQLLVALALTVAAPGLKDPPALAGEWAAEEGIQDGKPIYLKPGTTWTFTHDGKLVRTMGLKPEMTESDYTADPKKDPPLVDVASGPKGTAFRGIYKVEKDTLTLCFVAGEGDRPTAFAAPAGSKAVLMTLKRLKKKD